MITADQLLAHAIGDYILQSDWMACEKPSRHIAAAVHAVCYTLPFLLLTRSPIALAAICGSHFVIDRWRLARYVVWAKNWIGPAYKPWAQCSSTGYDIVTKPAWMSVWLLIIADNTLHVICNGVAIKFL